MVTHCDARMKCVGELKTINLCIQFELARRSASTRSQFTAGILIGAN